MPRSNDGFFMAVNFGNPSSARFTLPDEPRNLKLSMARTKSGGSSFSSTSLRKLTRGSQPETTVLA